MYSENNNRSCYIIAIIVVSIMFLILIGNILPFNKTDATNTTVITEVTSEIASTTEATESKPSTSTTATTVTEVTTTTTTATTTETTTTTTTTTVTITETEADSIISDEEYILLCNAVGHEAGSDSIPIEEKALVVEVIMNRVASPMYPNTIVEVIVQPGQFSGAAGYAYLGEYSYQVTDMVREGVDEYFQNRESYQHGYFSFYGDGCRNYFN